MTYHTPHAKPNMISHVFVYGTLKRGQCRGKMWPAEPISVVAAWTRGALFGRHDYPAMMPGDDRVLGELWQFDESDMETVMRVLDHIEGTNQEGRPDLYVRAIVEAFDRDGNSIASANAYHYGTDPLLDGFHRIKADVYVQWP